MKINVGTPDRIVRIVVGIAVIGLGYYFGSWWGAVGLVLILTSLVSRCPAYSLMRISTIPKQQKTTGQKH